MKAFIKYWNAVHYCIFLFLIVSFKYLNYLNPFSYLLKSKKVKNYYKNNGVDNIKQLISEASNDRSIGINVVNAGAIMGALVFIFLFGVFDFSQIFFSRSLDDLVFGSERNNLLFLACLITATITFNYYILFKNDVYLEYFEEFDGMSISLKKKYFVSTTITVLLIVTFFLLSFRFTR